ncbi:hypothetical protein ENBRE01_2745 [Enteropsectra breve]|nr:hypothetical protein ENBRE01_2745 [Enteropsectra breve]
MAKRTTADEKLQKIANFFRSRQDFFTLKELETKLPKECGFSSMQLSDMLKAALDEDLINCEKCGNTNIYWAFRFQQHHSSACEIEKTNSEIEGLTEDIKKKKKHLGRLAKDREANPERVELVNVYSSYKAQVEEIENKKKAAEKCSLEQYNSLDKEIEELKKTTNEYTDNIYTMQSFISSKYGVNKNDFNKNFSIPDDMDYY